MVVVAMVVVVAIDDVIRWPTVVVEVVEKVVVVDGEVKVADSG